MPQTDLPKINDLNPKTPRAGRQAIEDADVKKDFDPRVGTDTGRMTSNGGYLAEKFTDEQLMPPLAPYSHQYLGNHAPEPQDHENTESQSNIKANIKGATDASHRE